MDNQPITDIRGEEIRDSRGKPTLRVTVFADNHQGSFSVPSGASTGKNEVHELRDEKGGMSLALVAIQNIIAPALKGVLVTNQKKIDDTLKDLDGTPNLSRLGGNTIIGVSLAASRAAANSLEMPLFAYLRELEPFIKSSRKTPLLFVNLINGGKHAKGGSPFQEHQVIVESENMGAALQSVANVYTALGDILKKETRIIGEGDEGGYACEVGGIEDSFAWLSQAVQRGGGVHLMKLGADIAASSFWNGTTYDVLGSSLHSEEMFDLYSILRDEYGLQFIEDPFHEGAEMDFVKLCKQNEKMMIIGDDLTTTNPERVSAMAKEGAIRGVIIKPNQIGTLSDTLQAMKVARDNDIHCIVSHRSGDTIDDYIADLAFAFGCYGLKAGAPHKPERKVKYERLLYLQSHG